MTVGGSFQLSRILKKIKIAIKRLSKNKRNDDPAGVRWINSDLIGFTYRMKKIEAKVDSLHCQLFLLISGVTKYAT